MALTQACADMNARTIAAGCTLLLIAAQRCHTAVVNRALQARAASWNTLKIAQLRSFRVSPSLAGRFGEVRALTQAGAGMNARTMAAGCTLLLIAAQMCHTAVATALTTHKRTCCSWTQRKATL